MRKRMFILLLAALVLIAPGARAFTVEAVEKTYDRRASRRVYIYHTHTYEAYAPSPDAAYQETESWRTKDAAYNIVRVGEELTRLLEAAGVEVFHDETAYEPPSLSSAYARSLIGLQKARSRDGDYDLYIDLHRDSYASGNGANTARDGDTEAARFLFVVGKGTGQSDEEARPAWEQNQKIALFLSDALNAQVPSLSRGAALKSGSYNQHAAAGCLLIEAGNNRNSLDEALAAMPYLAQAICRYFDALD